MSLCQLDTEKKRHLRDKLEEITASIKNANVALNQCEGCLLCEITNIKKLVIELDEIASLYHFQASFFPSITGMDAVIQAVTTLSKKGYGALIAIEQTESLDPYILACKTTGAFIDAAISEVLLESIFFPGNPLHDGAVIIKDGKIVSAGCVLPLSTEKYTKDRKKIGTRHRAALGLSNLTDAIVLAVSEETQKVSVIQHGVMHPLAVAMCDYGINQNLHAAASNNVATFDSNILGLPNEITPS